MQNEFSRKQNLDALAGRGQAVTLEATAGEKKALAERAGILGVDAFSVRLKAAAPKKGVFLITGRLSAEVTLECRRTLKPFPDSIAEDFTEGYIREDVLAAMDKTEAQAFDDFEIFTGEEADLGEMAAQLLILSIDPFPVLKGAFPDKNVAPGVTVLPEKDAKASSNPFSKLKKLQKKA